MRNQSYDRIVIGGGVFGTYAALVLADKGFKVLLADKEAQLLRRASFVNQARLHSGLHYPRSLLTAREALRYSLLFEQRFPTTVRRFQQVYAIAKHNSRTSGSDFVDFIRRLGVDYNEIDPDRYFNKGTVERAFVVDEPTFDANILRDQLTEEIAREPNISVTLGVAVLGGIKEQNQIHVDFADGSRATADGVVIAAYAGTNALRAAFQLPELPLSFELAEVILGQVGPELKEIGFTVMDGPFWSLMPFGNSDEVSLTSVGLTPLHHSGSGPRFPCQCHNSECAAINLMDCNFCAARPRTAAAHQQKQMELFLRNASAFTPTRSLMTIKTILNAAGIDDARPTLVYRGPDTRISSVFSGKVSTVFDLERLLS